jgi:glutamate racemase
MVQSNIDYLVLGCSHYPYLIPQIKKIIPKKITIIDSGEAVARQTKKVLEELVGINENTHLSKNIFYTNTNPEVLKEILENKYPIIAQDF